MKTPNRSTAVSVAAIAGRALITAFSLMVLATTSLADTIPAGPVSGTWTAGGSPYLITGEIEVPLDQTLTIEPGVEVRFQGFFGMAVHGRLMAVGTANDSIRFVAENPATGWHSLRFMDTSTTGQPTSELRYCRVQDGKAIGSCPDNSGAGIYLHGATTLIANCLITNNAAVSGAGSWGGGGIYVDYCEDVSITDCSIVNNSSGNDGGGIYLYWSSPEIHGNLIAGNTAWNRGAGIAGFMYSMADIRDNTIRENFGEGVYLSGSQAWLVNNRIENNGGSGVYCYLSDAHIIGNLLAGNVSNRGGAIQLEGSDPWIINNTIADNDAGQGGGIYGTFVVAGIVVPSIPILTNNIVYGNTAGTGPQIYSNVNCSAILNHNNVQDLAGEGIYGTASLVTGNLDAPPDWVGAGDHPYALAVGSPCQDSGTPDASGLDLPALDLAGNQRIQGPCVDMGGYEFSGTVGAPDLPLVAAALLPNHPNPFNPRTTLTFRLPVARDVRLEVLDVAGRRVATLWTGVAPAGETRVEWNGRADDGRPLPSGAYFGRLVAGGAIATERMMLVR